MGTEPDQVAWPSNYFNYFTEIEEHFQKVRGTALFLMSPLDWALIETWKNAGVPLDAVLRGIDAAFEKWRAKKIKRQSVNSLAYCSQAVLVEAQAMAGVRFSSQRTDRRGRRTRAGKPPSSAGDRSARCSARKVLKINTLASKRSLKT